MVLNSSFKYFVCLALVVFCCACSPRETARVLGYGVQPFKDSGKIHKQTIDADFFTVYNKLNTILPEIGATVYRSSRVKGYIVANNFHRVFEDKCLDSTEVAIFLNEEGPDKTQVEISSLNFSLSDFAAERIFAELKK